MTRDYPNREVRLTLSGLLCCALAFACKIDNPDSPTGPTGPSSNASSDTLSSSTAPSPSLTVSAPTPLSPPPGANIVETRPRLVVGNATASDGSTPQYTFEVATDPAFTARVTQSGGVPQGPGGQTTWQVPDPLAEQRYYWRARAWVGSVGSPTSVVSDFVVGSAAAPETPSAPPGGLLVSDPLRGFSVGEVSGGRFLAHGWQVTSRTDYIRYVIPSLENGFVEWDASGLFPMNGAPEEHMMLGMWDPSRGAYRENPFRVHVQKLDTRHNRPYVRLRWIANGEEHNAGDNFLDWIPTRVYHWRLEWGPAAGENRVRLLLDGMVLVNVSYQRPYRPDVHWVELGVAERPESIVGAIYSNVRIGRR